MKDERGHQALPDSLVPGQWPTALAPMQDVTNLPYMKVVASCGVPDFFFTEYFRVHAHSRLNPEILRSITENSSGRPIFAQLIGENPKDLTRTVIELEQYPVAGIDLNMGCPAPKVYKKNVGGGLLRDPETVDRALGTLRECVSSRLTVKMRVGFEDDRNFETMLDLVEKHKVDLLSLHVRTVRGGYRSEPDYRYAACAVHQLNCPVLVNGDITSAAKAHRILRETGSAGVMIGRSAIRNPWIFLQIRQLQSNERPFRPLLRDVYSYVEDLYREMEDSSIAESKQVARMKKFLNFVGLGVDEEGQFLHEMRRAASKSNLFDICARYMLEDSRGSTPYPDEAFPGLVARPNQEGRAKPHSRAVQACAA